MRLENEYMTEISNDLFYEPERMLRSAPAVIDSANLKNFDPELFTSKDLILVSRITKTAPAIRNAVDEHDSFFPEMSLMVSHLNRRLADLLNYDHSESNTSSQLAGDSFRKQMDNINDIFNSDISEIAKLIEVSKRILDGRTNDKFSNSILSLDKNRMTKSSAGYSSLPPIQKDSISAKVFKGRKSVREITEQVSRRIKLLKSDPIEFKLLKEKIVEYRNVKNKSRKIQSAPGRQEMNITYSPASRPKLLRKWREEHESHRNHVLERKKKMDEEILSKKKRALQKKIETAAIYEKEREQSGKFHLMQRKWFIIVVIASRIAIIQKTLTESRRLKEIQMKRTHAALVIQRFYRDYRKRILFQLMRKSFVIIGPAFSKFITQRRRQQKHNAADIIRTFFKEVHDTSKLMKIVKKYRYAVIQAQSFVQSFLAVKHAREKVILKYADNLEIQWKVMKKKSAGKSQDDLRKSIMTLDDKRKPSMKRASLRREKRDICINIPTELKTKAILQNLSMRLKAFRAQNKEYMIAVEAHNATLKKRLYTQNNDEVPALKPVFQLFPPRDQIFAIFNSIHEGHFKA